MYVPTDSDSGDRPDREQLEEYINQLQLHGFRSKYLSESISHDYQQAQPMLKEIEADADSKETLTLLEFRIVRVYDWWRVGATRVLLLGLFMIGGG